ncbi:MAG TPA: protein kinase family protein, partial [Candidatus Angelobacter sp.]|nr:protein kinase family protein [Candidatus Angelobacter sp.]
MTFPMGQDYADAVQNLKQCILDPEFTGGVARKANGRLEVYSGGFSRVFPITVSRQVLALRCWTADVGDAEVRYREITSYLSSLKRDYFADFHYVRRGIRVRGQEFPIIRMEWIHGATLKDYIATQIHNPDEINRLADSFLQTVTDLHQHGISHG